MVLGVWGALGLGRLGISKVMKIRAPPPPTTNIPRGIEGMADPHPRKTPVGPPIWLEISRGPTQQEILPAKFRGGWVGESGNFAMVPRREGARRHSHDFLRMRRGRRAIRSKCTYPFSQILLAFESCEFHMERIRLRERILLGGKG